MAYGVTIGNDNGNDIRVIGIQALSSHGKDLFTTDYLARSIHKGLTIAIIGEEKFTLRNR